MGKLSQRNGICLKPICGIFPTRPHLTLCSCFNFYGWFEGSLVTGDNETKRDARDLTFVSMNKRTDCLVVHSVEGAWGVTYDTCMCGCDTHICLGYEVTQWSDSMPRPFEATQGGRGGNTDLFIQSIVVRLGASF